jgi:hypothetical protein
MLMLFSRQTFDLAQNAGDIATRENGYIESFNARLRDELLNGEIFTLCARPR